MSVSRLFSLLVVLLVIACEGGINTGDSSLAPVLGRNALLEQGALACYDVTVTSSWTQADHGILPADAGFSELIVIVHTQQYQPYSENETASNALILLAEQAKSGEMLGTFASQNNQQGIGAWQGQPDFRQPQQQLQFTLVVSTTAYSVSMLAGIVPSPDWFIAVAPIDLYNQQQFVRRSVSTFVAFDAGSEEGKTLSRNNANTHPREEIIQLSITNSPFISLQNPHLAHVEFSFRNEGECY